MVETTSTNITQTLEEEVHKASLSLSARWFDLDEVVGVDGMIGVGSLPGIKLMIVRYKVMSAWKNSRPDIRPVPYSS